MEDLETLAKNPRPPPRLELLMDDLETLAKSNPPPPFPAPNLELLMEDFVSSCCLM